MKKFLAATCALVVTLLMSTVVIAAPQWNQLTPTGGTAVPDPGYPMSSSGAAVNPGYDSDTDRWSIGCNPAPVDCYKIDGGVVYWWGEVSGLPSTPPPGTVYYEGGVFGL